jgi:hypothetical protein
MLDSPPPPLLVYTSEQSQKQNQGKSKPSHPHPALFIMRTCVAPRAAKSPETLPTPSVHAPPRSALAEDTLPRPRPRRRWIDALGGARPIDDRRARDDERRRWRTKAPLFGPVRALAEEDTAIRVGVRGRRRLAARRASRAHPRPPKLEQTSGRASGSGGGRAETSGARATVLHALASSSRHAVAPIIRRTTTTLLARSLDRPIDGSTSRRTL